MTSPIPIADRRGMTASRKLEAIIPYARCGRCGEGFAPDDAIEFDHIIPLQMGGDDDASNISPLHQECHAIKTAADRKAIAKAKRIDSWRKTGRHHRRKARPIKSRGFDKTRKRKLPSWRRFSGEPVYSDERNDR